MSIPPLVGNGYPPHGYDRPIQLDGDVFRLIGDNGSTLPPKNALHIIPGWDYLNFDEFHGYNGDCMEAALEICLAAAEHRSPKWQNMNALVEQFQQNGWAGSNGATTINACISYVCQQSHLSIITSYGYEQPARFTLDILELHAGNHPILLNVANGSALRDSWSGQGDEPGLHYHGVAILGKDPQSGSLIVADGDNPESTLGRYELYPMSAIEAAIPCGLLIFTAR